MHHLLWKISPKKSVSVRLMVASTKTRNVNMHLASYSRTQSATSNVMNAAGHTIFLSCLQKKKFHSGYVHVHPKHSPTAFTYSMDTVPYAHNMHWRWYTAVPEVLVHATVHW